MAALNALTKRPVLGPAVTPEDIERGGALLTPAGHSIVSSNPAVVAVSANFNGSVWHATGVAAGTAIVTATRLVDGATATLEVEVIPGVPFTITLGAESPA